jgi:hypothetical protein
MHKETLEEVRERLLLRRLEELEVAEAERVARRREPSVSRKIVATMRGGLQLGENGHVWRRLGADNEIFYGHLAYIRNSEVRKAWEEWLAT